MPHGFINKSDNNKASINLDPDAKQRVVGVRHSRIAAVEYDTTDARTQRVLDVLGVQLLDERVTDMRTDHVVFGRSFS